MGNRMTKPFLEVAQNKQTNTDVIANMDHILVCFAQREFEQDDLGDASVANNALELLGCAEQRHVVSRRVDALITNNPNGPKTDLGFAPQPIPQRDCLFWRSHQQSSFLAPENAAGQHTWEVMMREKERDIEPRHKIEEENSGNERVFGGDEINDQ